VHRGDLYIGSIPQATLNLQGLVYVRVKMSLQTLKSGNMIMEINHSYENAYFGAVCFTGTKLKWEEP
jgi:hypothetical protein